MSAIATAFQLTFQSSPIILTNGIATNIPGSMLPIIALTQGASFLTGLLTGTTNVDPDQFFAQFAPIPGGTIEEYQIGMYPFANQAIAANAIIAQPLKISMRMEARANSTTPYPVKIATIAALKATIDQHINLGGTFTVATPGYVYTNCILTQLRDVSTGDTKQRQSAWQWDFTQPLVSLQQVQAAQSAAMSRATNGLPWDGSWSGPSLMPGNQTGGAGATTLGASQPNTGISATSSSVLGNPFGSAGLVPL